MGWLVGRGLPKRQMCGDVRCDEGLRLDTGGLCETCECLVGARRARRQAIAAAVDTQMPRAFEAEEAGRATLQAAAKDRTCGTGPTAAEAATPVAVPVGRTARAPPGPGRPAARARG
ncbi:hypothetical protein AB0H73_34595 [Streptomyces olivoreticuli]